MKSKNGELVYEELYRSKDLPSCAFLIAKGEILESVEREGPICWFVFQDRKNCEKLTDDYWFGKATVSAKKFYESIQAIRNRIFQYGGKI
jgi:hypothetical protein